MSNDKKECHEAALKAYKQYSGHDYVSKSTPYDPPSIKDLAFLGFDRSYGESWSRPGLDSRTKSFVCMTITATLGLEDHLKNHIAFAHNIGITKDEVVELLIHLNGYIGTPRTNTALKVARGVWKNMGEKRKA